MVQTSSLQLQPVSGMLQVAPPGQSFQLVAIRATDSSTPPHSVLGATVAFLAYIGRMPGNEPVIWSGEAGISQPTMPIILAKSQASAQSDNNGIANFAISTASISGSVAVVGTATAGSSSLGFEAQQLGP
jgi:hypothetical protein